MPTGVADFSVVNPGNLDLVIGLHLIFGNCSVVLSLGMPAGIADFNVINLGDLELKFSEGEEVSLETLQEKRIFNLSGREAKLPLKVSTGRSRMRVKSIHLFNSLQIRIGARRRSKAAFAITHCTQRRGRDIASFLSFSCIRKWTDELCGQKMIVRIYILSEGNRPLRR